MAARLGRRVRVCAAGCLAAVIVAGSLAGPVAAAAPSAPRAQGLSVRPALSGETTLPSGHFTFALPAGALAGDAFVVQSSEPAPRRVAVYAADLLPATGGGVTPAAEGQVMLGVGKWLTLPAVTAPLPADGQIRVPFTLAIPAGAAPGTYNGAVVAEASAGTTAAGIPVGLRLALIVHVVVVAAAAPALTVGAVGPGAAAAPGGSEPLVVTVRNGGNVNLGVDGAIVMRNEGGAVVGRVPLGPAGLYVVPGGTAVLRGAFAWPRGLRRATATAVIATTIGAQPGHTYAGAPAALARPGGWPWRAVAALVAAGVVGWVFTAGRPGGPGSRRA